MRLAYAVAFAMVILVASTHKNGMEEMIKRRPAQMGREARVCFVQQPNSG
jgi:hypothetical protein